VIGQQLEFQISQYANNTLSAGERTALEAELERSAEARALLTEYRKLDEVLRREILVPEVNWDRLAEQISGAVGEEEIPGRRLVIGWGGRLALAASVLIAVGVGLAVYMKGTTPGAPVGPAGVAKVEGPSAEAATQPALVKIDVGPGDEFAEAQYQLSEGIVQRPSSVRVIASNEEAGQDTHRSPYQQ